MQVIIAILMATGAGTNHLLQSQFRGASAGTLGRECTAGRRPENGVGSNWLWTRTYQGIA